MSWQYLLAMACLHSCASPVNPCTGDRDDVVKFWDMRRIMEPTLHLALPKHLPKSEFLLPTVRFSLAHIMTTDHSWHTCSYINPGQQPKAGGRVFCTL